MSQADVTAQKILDHWHRPGQGIEAQLGLLIKNKSAFLELVNAGKVKAQWAELNDLILQLMIEVGAEFGKSLP